MYSELLVQNKEKTICYVLSHLHKRTRDELCEIYGSLYIDNTYREIKDKEVFVIRLKNNNKPVGLFGLIPQSDKSAGIFLLTTDYLPEGNMITFLKGVKKQIRQWEKRYSLIMDNCYKQNKQIIKWLTLLGFRPSNYQDDKFQIYYKGDIDEY